MHYLTECVKVQCKLCSIKYAALLGLNIFLFKKTPIKYGNDYTSKKIKDHITHTSGQIGITVGIGWPEPLEKYNPDDMYASVRHLAFGGEWFIHPIYLNGDYPEVMKEQIARKSREEGLAKSRLPEFTEAEKRRINGIR